MRSLSLSDTWCITVASILFGLAFAITGYLYLILTIGFFDRGLFAIAGGLCLLCSGIATFLLVPLDRIGCRILMTASLLLALLWMFELLALAFTKHK
jgi:hypothetical protein